MKRTLNTPVSPWEISDTYSELQMSAILINNPKIWSLGIRFLKTALKSQPILKISDKKITQETSLGWKEALPTALLCTRITPKEQVGFSPYEMLYGRPFVYVNDVFLDPEVQTLQSYTMAIGQFQQDISLWGMNQDPKDSKDSPLYAPGTQVLIKVERWVPQRLNSSPHGRAPTL